MKIQVILSIALTVHHKFHSDKTVMVCKVTQEPKTSFTLVLTSVYTFMNTRKQHA